MKKEDLLNTIGEINDEYIKEAKEETGDKVVKELKSELNKNTKGELKKPKRNLPYKIVGLVATASLCVVGYKIMNQPAEPINTYTNTDNPINTGMQIANPTTEVKSLKELEKSVGFSIPVLDKNIDAYLSIDYGNGEKLARIEYSDGSTFSMMKGNEDVSGIYGGELDTQIAVDKDTDSYTISYYSYEDTKYSTWQMKGFSFSLTEGKNIEDETNAVISQLK